MQKIYYIIDIKKRQSNFDLDKLIKKNSDILSLTPYSCYLLDNIDKKYITYHTIISIEKFRNKVFEAYQDIKSILVKHEEYGYIFRDIALIKTYEIYLNILFDFIKDKKDLNYKVIYISDTHKEEDIDKFDFTSNRTSGLYYSQNIDEFIKLDKRDTLFYNLMRLKSSFYKFIYTPDIFNKIKNSFFKKTSTNLYYDHKNFKTFWEKQKSIQISNHIVENDYIEFYKDIKNTLYNDKSQEIFIILYKKLFNSIKNEIENQKNIKETSFSPFVYLSNHKDFVRNLLYKRNNIPRVFWQHGSYFHEHIFLKYNEIEVADINFVANDFTKKIFLENGGNRVYSVGSINFNKKILDRKKSYDFVYIVNNMPYSWSGTYIDSKNAIYSMDGNDLYQKHKRVIELFGKKLKDKKICIKMQPAIVNSLLYVPLLELSNSYPNISIEFFTPLVRLIEESKYIISDYFSSEFINRYLHYQRDIILFKGFPTPIPQEFISDMEKMFILVNTIQDLE